jgi:hypothetical protein
MLPLVAVVLATASAKPAVMRQRAATAQSAQDFQTFHLTGPPRLRVTVPTGFLYDDDGNFTAAQSTVVIRWAERQIDCRQAVKLPAQWAPWTNDTPLSSQPTALSWPGHRYPKIIVTAFRDSGVYGIRAPVVLEMRRGRWEVVNRSPDVQEFTNRGLFFIRGSRLYVWDYEADSLHPHTAPQRYWLKTYRVRGSRLVLTRKRMTRRRYPSYDLNSFPDRRPIPAADDPLREFGLRFHWWGQSK